MRVLFLQYQILRDVQVLLKIPGLALGSIAANVDSSEFEVQICELFSEAVGKLSDEENIFIKQSRKRAELLKILDEFNPQVVALTSRTHEFHLIVEVAKIVREWNKDVKIFLGGYHASIAAEEILSGKDSECFDFLVRGEGEFAVNELLKAIKHKKDYSSIPNISYKQNGNIKHNPLHKLLNLDEIKIPARNKRILCEGFNFFGFPADVIETSRGCVYDCNFCCIRNIYGKSYRKYSIERVIEDLKDAQRHGAKAILLADDNIMININHFEKLLDRIIETRLNNLVYVMQGSIRAINDMPSIAAKMKEAGVKWVFLGIESPEPEQITFMQKANQFKKDEIAVAVKTLKKNNILTHGGIIFGTPDETRETIVNKYNYVKKVGLDFINFWILTPFPKTEVRDELLKENLVTNPDDYSKYNAWHANVRTRQLSSAELYSLVRKYEARFYLTTAAVFKLTRFNSRAFNLLLKLISRRFFNKY